MPQIRTILSASLLWLLVSAPAAAVEVLPMDSPADECGSEAAAGVEPAAQEPALIEDAELPAGLQAVGGSAVPVRAPTQGGGDSSTPAPAKPSSRWNAFLPGMVR
ncbi:hypothetical protein [Aquimonas voraii]|uniref:Uncharacterized protein n=1 Tax=Aquimonas voraii TaxID=265719 RepID=A0A1G6XYN7_9GAMM|nr:hypothetical protein [Aquimonas voraii]SDD83190.1 hypothetical protein SAMN04488509_10837 [Aquimonas voraii]